MIPRWLSSAASSPQGEGAYRNHQSSWNILFTSYPLVSIRPAKSMRDYSTSMYSEI